MCSCLEDTAKKFRKLLLQWPFASPLELLRELYPVHKNGRVDRQADATMRSYGGAAGVVFF